MAKQKDILWKVAIEQIFIDFISFIDEGLVPLIDLDNKYEFLNKELIGSSQQQTENMGRK